MVKNKVKYVVRVCTPTYDADRLQDAGIQVVVSVCSLSPIYVSLSSGDLNSSPHSTCPLTGYHTTTSPVNLISILVL